MSKTALLVSMVANATDVTTRNYSALVVINAIKTGGKKVRPDVELVRAKFRDELGQHGDRKRAKQAVDPLKKQLAAVLWSGVFSERNSNSLVQHSGLLCADLDSLNGELPVVREKLLKSPHVWALFKSPSGDGLKAVFRVPADAVKHAGSFRAVEKHVLELTGVQIDEKCKDLARLCFLSYDPELSHNPNATQIESLPEPEKPERRLCYGTTDLWLRQRIAVEILGTIDWQSETTGFCTCPGKHLHTAADGLRDCEILLDGAPTLRCFHNSCIGILAGVNHELRSRIGKAERVSQQFPNLRGETANYGDAYALQVPPTPYVSPPLALLPASLQNYIVAAAASLNVDPAFILLPVLAAIGSAIGNACSILVKRRFIQPPIIWSAIIGRSGSRKTPALEAACAPVLEHERELMCQNKEAREIYDNELATWEANRKGRGKKPEQPVFRTCLTDDMTLEVLADVIQNNPRGVLNKKDELSHWFASHDQYKSAKGSDVSRWLSLHNGVFFAVDRRSDRRHYRIHDPRVCITGGIQQKVLRRVLSEDFFDRGLPARFLFAAPPFRQDRWTEDTIPERVSEAVLKLFDALYQLQPESVNGESRPRLLQLDPDAKRAFVRFYNETGATAIASDERDEATWSKLGGYAARLALVGQLPRNPASEIVTAETMQAACELAQWFGNEQARIYATFAETREQRDSRRLIEFVESRDGHVTVRDVMQSYRPLKNNKGEAERQLNALVKIGRGKWVEQTPGRTGGRPTREFQTLTLSTSTQPNNLRGQNGGCVDVDTSNSQENTVSGEVLVL